ncbi:hypothetical protein OEZ86_004833 [Tetradesmus obliquus]|nr:hypothetical protein OEZ86_004833 [Tetradesmus obliquus]
MKRHVRCRAAERAAAGPAKVDPFAPENKVAYNDGWLDRIFMKLFTSKIADQLEPGTVSVPNDTQYEDFVRVSKEILRGRSTQEQHALVRRVLLSLVPPGVPAACKVLFRPTQWAAEVNAAVASWGFFWLVGDSELRSQGVEVAPGVLREQKSVVHIKKCRYLEASGCVGLCVNMCKVPTQSFFTNDFGMPLTMNPNFEDLSCEMVFGQASSYCVLFPGAVTAAKPSITDSSSSSSSSTRYRPCSYLSLISAAAPVSWHAITPAAAAATAWGHPNSELHSAAGCSGRLP